MKLLEKRLVMLIPSMMALLIGIYIGGQLANAVELTSDYSDPDTEQKYMVWLDNTSIMAEETIRSLSDGESIGWMVPNEWMVYQVHKSIARGDEFMHFVLAETQVDRDGNRTFQIVANNKYHLMIRGYNGENDISWCQDIPPKIDWP